MSSKKPNIILITSDQQHWSTIGKLNPEIKTPNLDKLAEDGVIFTNAYTVDPTCTPSRASILTGKYPSQHGAYSLGTRLDESKNVLITNQLRDAGYSTTLIGKAHFEPLLSTEEYPSIDTTEKFLDYKFWDKFHGPYYGFDHVEMQRGHGNTEVGQHYALWLKDRLPNFQDYFVKPQGNMPYPPLLVGMMIPQLWKLPEKYHHSRWIEERTINQLDKFKENNKDEPFFMWVSFLDPHYPNICPDPWFSLHDPKKITVPKIEKRKDRKLNPFLRITQKKGLKFFLRLFSRLTKLIWELKSRKKKVPKDNSKKIEPVNGQQFANLIKKLRKIPFIKRFYPSIKYYIDFLENEQSPQFIHGLHPHVHLKSEHAQSIATLYGSVSLMDDCIGNILKRLEENGQDDNTIILFTSDHGDYFGQHGLFHKGPFLYDDGLKIPFIAKIPGQKQKNKISSSYVSLMDIAPTVLSMAGIDIPEEINGVDQSEVFKGTQDSARDHVICEMRQSPRKVLMNTFVTDHFKIAFYYDEEFGELFDLKKDPQENKNLWNDHRYVKLKNRLMLEYITKRSPEDFERYKSIWKEFDTMQLLHVVHEYIQQSYRPDLMPRIYGA